MYRFVNNVLNRGAFPCLMQEESTLLPSLYKVTVMFGKEETLASHNDHYTLVLMTKTHRLVKETTCLTMILYRMQYSLIPFMVHMATMMRRRMCMEIPMPAINLEPEWDTITYPTMILHQMQYLLIPFIVAIMMRNLEPEWDIITRKYMQILT